MINKRALITTTVTLIFVGVGLMVDACRGSRECEDANVALRQWHKVHARLGPLEERRVRENGRESTWFVGPATYEGQAYSTTPGLPPGFVPEAIALVRLPTQPDTVFINIYISGQEVRSEDELLFYSKQWPRRLPFAASLLILMAGLGAGLWAGDWLTRRSPLAQTPLRAFPVESSGATPDR